MNFLRPKRQTRRQAARFVRTVDRTIIDHNMIEPSDSVLVGLSGGPDSTALLHVLVDLSKVYDLKLAVAYLNHNIRPEVGQGETARVRSIADKLNLLFFSQSEDVPGYRRKHRLSLEEAARLLRYRFFERTARRHGYKRIAVGHHADDNAELVLMYLMRGSGTAGLSGIPPVRGGNIIRPLIRVTRKQILRYLAAKDLSYLTDRSNKDTTLTRNRIRNTLLPVLKKDYNPAIVQALNRLAEVVRTEQDWTDSLVEKAYRHVCLSAQDQRIDLSVPRLAAQHVAVQRRILRRAVEAVKGDLRRISYGHTQDALRTLDSGSGAISIDFPDGLQLHKCDRVLRIVQPKPDLQDRSIEDPSGTAVSYNHRISGLSLDPVAVSVDEIGARFVFRTFQRRFAPDIRKAGLWVAFFDMDAVKLPITIRNFRPGDRFVPLGISGSQKVKQFFIDHKVPRHQRAGWPMMLGADEIIWIVGHRISDRVKLRSSTNTVLEVTCDLPTVG